MKFRFIGLVFVVWCNASWADFSNSDVLLHPLVPEGAPYLIDITGEWPSDCHPGEQKPVISKYTGDSVLIEFETIVEHVNCNDVVTLYRVLVDMSDVVGNVDEQFNDIDITVRFDGADLNVLKLLSCALVSPCPSITAPHINPEPGLYDSKGLEKQGLLLARQNQRMAVYPLIYDDSGSSEWLIGPGGIFEDVFFSELFELTGGQCLGCPPPDEPTELNKVGKLSMLMDSEGLIQVKVNDGLFTTYEQSKFGYGEFEIVSQDDDTLVNIPDLSGRWAFSESDTEPYQVMPPLTSVLPLVFDLTLRSNVNPPLPVLGAPNPPGPSGGAWYSFLNMDGEPVAQMLCMYREQEMVCDFDSPTIDDSNTPFAVKILSVERMIFTSTSPDVTGGEGVAVRID